MSARRRRTRGRAPEHRARQVLGKAEGDGNYPAVPSLSVTLAGLATRTRVELVDGAGGDELVLNGAPADARALERATALLDRVRSAAGHERACGHRVLERLSDRRAASRRAPPASRRWRWPPCGPRGSTGARSGRAISRGAARRAPRGASSAASSSSRGERTRRSVTRSSPRAPVAPGDHLPLRVLVCVATEGDEADRLDRGDARDRDDEPVPRRPGSPEGRGSSPR